MKFLGVPYPVTRNPRGFFRSSNGIDQIKSDLLQLLLTNPGERVMLPNYGTALKSLIFDPNDAQLETAARQMIINSINQWEPRITIQQIEINSSVDPNDLDSNDPKENVENILAIKILFFDPENIKEVEELKLELPLGVA